MSDPNCLFCRILRGEIPAKKVYEDEHVLAFEDINPQAPTHVLIIPKRHFAGSKKRRQKMPNYWALPSGSSGNRAPTGD